MPDSPFIFHHVHSKRLYFLNKVRYTGERGKYNLNWSGKRDSNPRPSRWERDALPTELFPQISNFSITLFYKNAIFFCSSFTESYAITLEERGAYIINDKFTDRRSFTWRKIKIIRKRKRKK